MDQIHINDLRVNAIIGVYENERVTRQPLIINVTLNTDISKAAITDDLGDAVDYDDLAKEITNAAQNTSCQLIETLAVKLANICLANKKVNSVTIKIEKPGAIANARSSAVVISRGK
ncbi:MAG: dihydroneopterin aldolase [bacterium]